MPIMERAPKHFVLDPHAVPAGRHCPREPESTGDRSEAETLSRRMSALGRKYQFAASGSSRWPGIAAGWLNLLRAPPPTKVRSRGVPASRSGGRPRSGIGVCRHSSAHRGRLPPVSSGCSGRAGDGQQVAGSVSLLARQNADLRHLILNRHGRLPARSANWRYRPSAAVRSCPAHDRSDGLQSVR